jgi:hypothetical protein
MGDANIFGALADGPKEHFGRGTMRIFLQEVMLDLPHEIEAEPIAEFDLLQRLPVDIVFAAVIPRPWHLHFKMQTEFHNSSVTSMYCFLFVVAAVQRWVREQRSTPS